MHQTPYARSLLAPYFQSGLFASFTSSSIFESSAPTQKK